MDHVRTVFNTLKCHIHLYSGSIIASAAIIVCWYFKSFAKKKNQISRLRYNQDTRESTEINDVLFFSEKTCGLKNLDKMIQYLKSAEKSLDICVYTITYNQFALPILKKFKEGKRIRILTDLSMSYGDGSQIPMFRKHGVLVRGRSRTSFLMHHKFAIVDDNLLINGSLNWTSQGVNGNDENVTVTSNPDLVKKFKEYFEEQWEELNF